MIEVSMQATKYDGLPPDGIELLCGGRLLGTGVVDRLRTIHAMGAIVGDDLGERVVRMGDVVKEEPGFTLQHWFDWSRAVHRWDTRRSRMKRLGMDFDNLFPAGVYASPRHLGNVAFRYYARLSVFWTFVTTLALVAAKLACGVMAARVARRQTGTWRGPSGHSENC
jgi:hypothetical protein